MNILVTGATGFVGKNLIPKLISSGHQLLEITVEEEVSRKLYGNKINRLSYKNCEHNILVEQINEFKPETVIHLASYLTSSDNYEDLLKLVSANIVFFLDILDSIKYNPPKLFINTGTFAEYFLNDEALDPAYIYAATKTSSRYLLKYYSGAYGFKGVTLVPFSIYGPNDSQKKMIDYLIDAVDSPLPIDFSAGEQVLDFIHVNDIAEAYISLLKNYHIMANNETFFAGTGKGISVRELAVMIEEISGKKLNVIWGGRAYRNRDIMKAIAPLKKNNNRISWKASVDIKNGLIEKLKDIK
jgi:nucleoside-diphosphate-sugar epimerase